MAQIKTVHMSHCINFVCCDSLCGLLNLQNITDKIEKVTCKKCKKLISSKSVYTAPDKEEYPRSGGSVEETTALKEQAETHAESEGDKLMKTKKPREFWIVEDNFRNTAFRSRDLARFYRNKGDKIIHVREVKPRTKRKSAERRKV